MQLEVFAQLALIAVGGIIAARAGQRLRIPAVIPLLIAGYLLGPDVLNLLRPAELGINLELLAAIAVPLVLFYDGLKTDPKQLGASFRAVAAITTVAVLFTVFGIGVVAHFVFGLSWLASLLLGAILSSTDPAAIIPVLRKLNISKKVSGILEAETAFNDAAAISLFMVIVGVAAGQTLSLTGALGQFLLIIISSVAAGLAVGWLFVQLLRFLRAESDLLMVTLIILASSFGVAEYFGGSGAISAVVTAIIIGAHLRGPRVEPLARAYTFSAWDEINFIAIALVFIVLGAEISVASILPFLLIGIVLSLAFVYLVRPMTVLVSMFFEKEFSVNEKLFISWVGGPRGTVSAALAAMVMAKAAQGAFPSSEANAIFGITIVVICFTVVVTSLTAGAAAKFMLGAVEDSAAEKYRRLSVELKAMRIASKKLYDEWNKGLISTKMYNELNSRHMEMIARTAREIAELAYENPALEDKERITHVKRMLATQINTVNDAFDNKEISEQSYHDLMKKYDEMLGRLSEVEASAPDFSLQKEISEAMKAGPGRVKKFIKGRKAVK
ncbi:MAG: sodium:proton antiporter [Candidatus Micrarchaeota archaeon]